LSFYNKELIDMRKCTRAATGKQIGKGLPDAKLSGVFKSMASQALSLGKPEGTHKLSIGKALALGKSSGSSGSFRKKAGRLAFSEGGHATDLGFEKKGERLEKVRKRAATLEQPGYAKGGKVYKDMRALYEALHSHFENEPQMKRLRTKKADVYQGEPHHSNYHHEPRHKQEKFSRGGRAKHRSDGGEMNVMGGYERHGRIIPVGKRRPMPEGTYQY
jgi:hypothetical protein